MFRRALIPGALAFALIIFVWSVWWEPASLRVDEECVALRWPLQPLRVAVLSDLHVGSPFNGPHKLTQIVDRTNEAGVDLVFVLGDLVIQGVVGGAFIPPESIAVELQRLKSRYGTFAVLGNHENWLGAARVRRALTNAGIEVLEDGAIKVHTAPGDVWIAGLRDFRTGYPNVNAMLSQVTDQAPLVVLTHNPDVFPELPPRINLTLAGHTHGGQVRLPFFGSPIVPSNFGQRFVAGHIVEHGRDLYVATGIGTSILPIRFRVPPSIVVLTIASYCP